MRIESGIRLEATYRCSKCNQNLNAAKFCVSGDPSRPVQRWCKDCFRAWGKEYNQRPDVKRHNAITQREYCWKVGIHSPITERKETSPYLGNLAEEVLSRYFENVVRMPNNNPGFDFICKRGYKIDVKSACLLHANDGRSDAWNFHIRKNKIADKFLCIALRDRKSFSAEHIWLIDGQHVSNRKKISIRENSLAEWAAYEKPIDMARITDSVKSVLCSFGGGFA